MANASGFFTPSVPSLRRRIQPPIGIFGSGSRSPEGFSTRVFCCSSTTEGADKLASGASSSESRVPRYVSFFFFFFYKKISSVFW